MSGIVNQNEENEIEYDNLLSQALPVANLPKNIDLCAPPITGEDYLSRVRLEASKSANVVVAKINTKKFEKNRTPQYFQPNIPEETRKEFKAPTEWQYEKSIEFSEIRERVRKEKDNFVSQNSKKNHKFPKLKSKDEWYAFCFGKSISNQSNSVKSSSQEVFLGNKPLLNILYEMDQATIVQLLDYHVEWVEETGYSKEAFEWIYALMCFVVKPLLPETHSTLRNLARTCLNLRSKLINPEDECLTNFNLFISLVGRYFEQIDLADKDDEFITKSF